MTGRLLQIAAGVLVGAAVFCLLLMPFVATAAYLRPGTVQFALAGLACAALAAVPFVLVPVSVELFDAGRRLLDTEHGCHCRRCGYDLRATVGLCPECGTEM